MASSDVVDLAAVFKALGDENRLRIFQLIRERCPDGCSTEGDIRGSVSNIAAEFDLALSTVSHHLKELRNAGLIICERRGQRILCAPNEKALAAVEQFLRGVSV